MVPPPEPPLDGCAVGVALLWLEPWPTVVPTTAARTGANPLPHVSPVSVPVVMDEVVSPLPAMAMFPTTQVSEAEGPGAVLMLAWSIIVVPCLICTTALEVPSSASQLKFSTQMW